MRRYALRDDQWDRIKDFLPGGEGHVGGTAADNRLFVEAVLFRYRAGIPWREPRGPAITPSIANATWSSASSTNSSTFELSPHATTSSPKLSSPEFNWLPLSSCSTEDRP